jgi:hypothetical protein
VQEFQGVDGNDGGLEPDSSHSGQIVNNAAIGPDEREPSQGPQGAHHDLSSRPLNNLRQFFFLPNLQILNKKRFVFELGSTNMPKSK